MSEEHEEYKGPERRKRDEVLIALQRIDNRLDIVEENQAKFDRKINDWELTADVFRRFVIGTTMLLGTLAAAWEWFKEHIR